jgi:hypothetical protein
MLAQLEVPKVSTADASFFSSSTAHLFDLLPPPPTSVRDDAPPVVEGGSVDALVPALFLFPLVVEKTVVVVVVEVPALVVAFEESLAIVVVVEIVGFNDLCLLIGRSFSLLVVSST